jgi:hypothetical protein
MTNYEDYFKALICGHSHYEGRGWIMLKGYFDDSKDDDQGVLVLGGYIANSDGWTAYNKACQKLLDGLRFEEFKMNQLGGSDSGMEKAFWLYRQAIEPNVLGRVAIIVPIAELKEAVDSFPWPENIKNRDIFNDPYFLSWKGVVSTITHGRIEAGNPNPVELVFDHQNAQEDEILRGWLDFKKDANDEQIEQVGGMPLFGDSKKILPLQAADQYAWWVRKWFIESKNDAEFEEKIDNQPFTWGTVPVEYKRIPHETIKLSKPVIYGVLKAMFDIHEVQKVTLAAVL